MELVKEIKTYKVADEQEAIDLIESFRERSRTENFDIGKASYVLRQKKSKGVVIDEYYLTTVELKYDI